VFLFSWADLFIWLFILYLDLVKRSLIETTTATAMGTSIAKKRFYEQDRQWLCMSVIILGTFLYRPPQNDKAK